MEIWAFSVQLPMDEIQYSTWITCLALNRFTLFLSRKVSTDKLKSWSLVRCSAALLLLKEIPDVVDVLPGGLPGMPCCILYFWDLLGGVTRKGDVIEDKPSKIQCTNPKRNKYGCPIHYILAKKILVGRKLKIIIWLFLSAVQAYYNTHFNIQNS